LSIKYKLNPKYKNFEDEIFNIKKIFAKDNEIIHNARNVLKIIPMQGVDIVVKAFRIPNAINQFAYAYIRRSKAYKSFFNAMKLQELSINTPTPIGFIEFYSMGFLKKSYFLSKHYPYDITMADVRDDKPKDRVEILQSFAAYTYELHQKGIWHVDYSGGNILITRSENGYEFALVDINRMVFKDITPEMGLENFNKLWLDEDDLSVIAKAYAPLAGLDTDNSVKVVIEHDRKLKAYILRRRKFKSYFVSPKQ